jgi:hypothetical protein
MQVVNLNSETDFAYSASSEKNGGLAVSWNGYPERRSPTSIDIRLSADEQAARDRGEVSDTVLTAVTVAAASVGPIVVGVFGGATVQTVHFGDCEAGTALDQDSADFVTALIALGAPVTEANTGYCQVVP